VAIAAAQRRCKEFGFQISSGAHLRVLHWTGFKDSGIEYGAHFNFLQNCDSRGLWTSVGRRQTNHGGRGIIQSSERNRDANNCNDSSKKAPEEEESLFRKSRSKLSEAERFLFETKRFLFDQMSPFDREAL
jgi:hypothetical protein